jgi:hypothetical protein
MGIEEVFAVALDSVIADASVAAAADWAVGDLAMAGAGAMGGDAAMGGALDWGGLSGAGAFGTDFGLNGTVGGLTDMGATTAFGAPETMIPETGGAFGSSGFGASPLMQSGVGNLMAPAGGGLTAADAGLTSAADLGLGGASATDLAGGGTGGSTPSAMDVLRGGNIAKDVAQGDYKGAALGGLGMALPAVIGSGTGIDTGGASDLTNAVTSTGDVASSAVSVAPDVSGAPAPLSSAATAGAADISPSMSGAISPGANDMAGINTITPEGVASQVTNTAIPQAMNAGGDAISGLKTLGSSLGINSLKDAAPLAGLGMSAYSQSQANKTLGNMQNQIKSTVAPLNATQQKLLDNFNAGTLSANDTQAIQDWTTSQKAQAQQYYSSAGLGGSSQMTQAMAQIDQHAKAMHDQALQNYLTEATATTGAITGPYSTLANQQIAQDAQLQAAAARLFSSMGNTTSASAQGKPADATT